MERLLGIPRLPKRWGVRLAGACAGVAALGLAMSVAAAPKDGNPQTNGLKTQPIDVSKVAPLRDAIFDYDAAVKARGGKAPEDAGERLKRIKSVAPQAKAAIKSFVNRLRANGETEAYDAQAEERARQSGSQDLVSELRGGGGATSILSQADRLIDGQIAERGRAAGQNSVSSVLDFLLGVPEAQARSSHLCGAFYWLISAGYGTNLSYRACYY